MYERDKHKCMMERVLVFSGGIAIQIRHALLIMYASDGLGQKQTNVDGLNSMALHLLDLVRNRVSDDHFVDERSIDDSRRVRREQAVCGHHVDFVGTSLAKHFGRSCERFYVIDHILLLTHHKI